MGFNRFKLLRPEIYFRSGLNLKPDVAGIERFGTIFLGGAFNDNASISKDRPIVAL